MSSFKKSQKLPKGYISVDELMDFLKKKYREYSDRGEWKERNTIIKVIDEVNKIYYCRYDTKIDKNKVIELYKQYNNYYTVTTKLCPAEVTYQEWSAVYYNIVDIITKYYNIKPKFKIGQKVWVILEDEPTQLFINSINIPNDLNTNKLTYNLVNSCVCIKYKENEIFATKEDLENN